METFKAIETRKSVRGYTSQSVEKEKLQKVISVANKVPNAGAFQVTVITDAKLLKEINDATLEAMKNSGNAFLVGRASLEGYQPLYGAPVLTIFSAEKKGYYQINTANAATAVTIAANDAGFASCFIITPTLALDGKNELSKKLKLPNNFAPVACVLLGYGAEDKFSHPRVAADNINYL